MLVRQLPSKLAAAIGLMLAAALGSCSSSSDNNGNGGDVTDFHQQLGDAFDNGPGFQDALYRLALTISGTPQAGVSLTPTADGFIGSVDADIDGDGTNETTVNGTLVFITPALGMAGGANLTITGIDGGAPQTATGSAVLTATSPTTLEVSNGTFTTHTDTRGNDLHLTNGELVADASNPVVEVTGTVDFDFNGLDGLLTLEVDQTNGYQIVVSGNGFDTFTVP